jgi:hypothetical protein
MNPFASSKKQAHQFNDSHLIPEAWLRGRPLRDFYLFNPSIIRHRGRLLMVYRVDQVQTAGSRPQVSCAICELDDTWRIVAHSVVPLSDTIVDGGTMHYDPRFFVWQDRLFIHYNNNWLTKPNQIYLVELDPDTLEARAPARMLALEGSRQEIEKNWMLFEHEGDPLAIYQIQPHVVLGLDFAGCGPITCQKIYTSEWDVANYAARYGAPRGGAPPVRAGDIYVSFFHSRWQQPILPRSTTIESVNQKSWLPHWLARLKRFLRGKFTPVIYYGGVYGFMAAPPFTPIFIHSTPILRPEQEDKRRRPPSFPDIAPRIVVFPTGVVRLDDKRWLISYGVHDERCNLRVFNHHDFIPESLHLLSATGRKA